MADEQKEINSGVNTPILEWIVQQNKTLTSFADVLDRIKPDQQSISVARIREVLARLGGFTFTQVTYLLIFKEKRAELERSVESLFNNIYLNIKEQVTTPGTDIAKKYSKKAATGAEIEMEMKGHPDYRSYLGKKMALGELVRKIEGQELYLKKLEKIDSSLNSILMSHKIDFKNFPITGEIS